MLAVPVDSLGENPVVSDYFGKSKWFALVEDDMISFEKNKFKNGCDIVQWLYDLGVDKTVINHIGVNPLLKLKDLDIECLFYENGLHSLVEVFERIENKMLLKADSNNMDKIIDIQKGCNELCE